MTAELPNRWLADLSLLTTACLWGINIPVVRFAAGAVDPFVFNAVRMGLSTLIMGALVWSETRYRAAASGRYDRRRFVAFALISGLIYPLLFMQAIRQTTAGNAALLLSSMPGWTALLSRVFLHERLSSLTWLGLSIAFCGTAAVVMGGHGIDLSSRYLAGNLWMLTAALCWATATVASGRLLQQISPLKLTFFSSLLTSPMQLALVSPRLPEQFPLLISGQVLAALLYSGIFSTGLAYVTWHYGVRQLGASHASVFQNVVTLVAVGGGWMFLGESLVSTQLAGGLLIVAGLLLIRYARDRT